MKKIIVLAFDIPRDKPSFRVKIWRELQDLGVDQRLRSHCTMPFSKRNLSDLKVVARKIRRARGRIELLVGTKVM